MAIYYFLGEFFDKSLLIKRDSLDKCLEYSIDDLDKDLTQILLQKLGNIFQPELKKGKINKFELNSTLCKMITLQRGRNQKLDNNIRKRCPQTVNIY